LDNKDTFRHNVLDIMDMILFLAIVMFYFDTKIFDYLYEDESYKVNIRVNFWGVIFHILMIIKK
jgi:hypothetical protein